MSFEINTLLPGHFNSFKFPQIIDMLYVATRGPESGFQLLYLLLHSGDSTLLSTSSFL